MRARSRVAGALLVALVAAVAWWAYPRARAPFPAVPGGAAPTLSDRAVGERPTLWVLAVGVSRYAQPDLNLRYADVDARAIAEQLAEQSAGPIYRETKTLVLTDDDVTRESVFRAMQQFLGQAGPEDVAVIFLAGHGVQDRTTRSYYFLPHGATPETLITDGLRMSDFDEMVRGLRRNVGRVVVMLDTCHAGAFQLASRAIVSADDLAEQVSAAEGLFLLAAAKPGEESKEHPRLGHGAFTYAVLEGLRGGADADGDGIVSVTDLFSFVARHVPRLTRGEQHPYHKIEGTDLVLAAVEGTEATAMDAGVPGPAAVVEAPSGPVANSIAVLPFENVRGDPEHDWIGVAVRAALNTELSKVRELSVVSPELFDQAAGGRGRGALDSARLLRLDKMLTGSYTIVGDQMRIDARLVDASTGRNLPGSSDNVEGPVDDFFSLQKALTLALLQRLEVDVSADEAESIIEETNTSVPAYRLLLQAENEGRARGVEPADQAEAAAPPGPQSRHHRPRWWAWLGPAAANAEAPGDTVTPTRDPATAATRILETYRIAHESGDLDRLTEVYTTFSAEHRAAIQAYLDATADLHIVFDDVRVEPRGDRIALTYTRRDEFVDRRTGEPQRLEIRSTKLLVRSDGRWKIAVEP